MEVAAEQFGVTLFDDEFELLDVSEDENISSSTIEKVAIAKAYFAEYYFELLDYLGAAKKRHEQGKPPEPHALRTRRFTSMSVPPLFHFGKVVSVSPNASLHKKKRFIHTSSLLVFDDLPSSGPPSPSSSGHSSSGSRRGDTLKNLNRKEILSKPMGDLNKRKAYSMQFRASDKSLLEETQKMLEEKEHMTDVAAQLGKSLLAKVEEYEQQISELNKKIEVDEQNLKRMSEFQSEAATWKEKCAVLAEKLQVVEAQNERLEGQIIDLNSKHKEERERIKPLLLRHQSLRNNLNDLEILKDERASSQAAENNYKRQMEITIIKNRYELEKEVERLYKMLEEKQSSGADSSATAQPSANKLDDLVLLELGVSFHEMVSLLERLLRKMLQVEQETNGNIDILRGAGQWITCITDMQSLSQPLIFRSLSSKLVESGIVSLAKGADDIDGTESSLKITTLLLVCVVALQMSINSSTIYMDSITEWKRKCNEAEKETQALKLNMNNVEGECSALRTRLDKLQQTEMKRRMSMVSTSVNTTAISREDRSTNTKKTQVLHKELVSTGEIGINADSEEAPKNAQKTTNEEQVELLKKEIVSLREELNKINGPSQRVLATSWEKNYHSDLQGPLLRYINSRLQGHPHLSHLLPANPDRHINRVTYDGVLLLIFESGCLVNCAHPGILDERVVNFVPASDLEVKQNFSLTINTALAMGCSLQVTNPETLLSNPHSMIDVVYQLVKSDVFAKLSVEYHPEFLRLRKEEETLAKFRSIGPSKILQRWADYHHHQSNITLPPILSEPLSHENLQTIFSSLGVSAPSVGANTDWLSQYAIHFGVEHPALMESSLIGNILLQSLFLAQIAHASSGLSPLSENEVIGAGDTDPAITREERAFVTWINGLGIPIFVSNLQCDMTDGLVLLNIIDKISRGCINWKEVNLLPNNAYKKMENCNLGLKFCTNKLNFSLVGIGGKDIFDGNRKFILAIIWQACKYHLLTTLRTCGDGVEVTEADVLSFLNKRIPQPISSFKDSSLRTALPLLDLLLHLAPDVVKQDNIRRRCPISPEECLLNSKYAIGLARKIFILPSVPMVSTPTIAPTIAPTPPPSTNPHVISPRHLITPASVHPKPSPAHHKLANLHEIPLCLPILPEDIVEVNPKMLFVFVAMMMLVDKAKTVN